MSLDLDERQRAMLQEMQVRVWWPAAAPPEPLVRVLPPAALVPVAAVPSLDAMDMPALARAVAQCTACRLCEGRKTAVFSPPEPARQADWLVVGDPPTEEDERAGTPFATAEGELLDNMLRAVQCSRTGTGAAGAWLTPVVKCRPAMVRNPQPDELARCAVYLRREVALVRPRVILAMGRFAALSLLADSDPDIARVPAGKLRGRLHRFEGVPVVVTYSPARLLRAPLEKAGAWADLCLARSAALSGTGPAEP